jgi:hypothetical protein
LIVLFSVLGSGYALALTQKQGKCSSCHTHTKIHNNEPFVSPRHGPDLHFLLPNGR